ncbi:MAG: glutaredoxin family protein [Pseudomonadota bacterium]
MKARLFLFALLLATAAQAQTYRWVDKEGKVHYGDRPPAAVAGQVQERRLGAPAADKTLPYNLQQAVANFPVTLYVSTDCGDGCKDGRDYLKARGIPFSEKSVATSEEVEALKKLAGGEAVVPVLTVGSKNAKGWLKDDWQRLLDAAGYPKEKR